MPVSSLVSRHSDGSAANFSPDTNPNVIGRNVFVDAYEVVHDDGFETPIP